MDEGLKLKKLANGDAGFDVPMGWLDKISDEELEARYKKICDAVNSFTTLRYVLEEGEIGTLTSKLSALKKRRSHIFKEIDRRRNE